MTIICTYANLNLQQVAFGDDGSEGRPLFALKRGKLVEPVQPLTSMLQGFSMLTKMHHIDLLESVHTSEPIVVVFKRVITDFLQLAVAIDYSLEKDALQGLLLTLGILRRSNNPGDGLTSTLVICLVTNPTDSTIHVFRHFCHKSSTINIMLYLYLSHIDI